MFERLFLAVLILAATGGTAHAAHPLITDDTGTQGKGKVQLEFLGEYEHGNKDGITQHSIVIPPIPVISYGITETIDLVLGISYEFLKTEDAGNTTSVDGISDTSIELKWRFYESDGLSFALKPGFTLPTGNDEKGLGTGKATYHLFFISTKEVKPWAFHLNLGYIRNENTADERRDIWHASLAGVRDVLKNVKAVANTGVERNRDETSNASPAFVLGGFIHSVSEQLDVDIGVKKGINNNDTDYSLLAGITWRF